MKKTLLSLFITILFSNFVTAQSIVFTSETLTTAAIGTTITVNYEYTSANDGHIYCGINLLDDWTWISTVVTAELSPAPAGTNVQGSFQITIPVGTVPTANLTGNQNYKINIELKDSNFVWLAGAYPETQINLTGSEIPTAISFTSAPLESAEIGTTIPVDYQYSIPNPGKIYCAIELFDNFTYLSTVAESFLDPVEAGTNIQGTFNFTIPSETVPTENLATGLNYKIKIVLFDSNGEFLAGAYPSTQINFTASLSNTDFENNQIFIYPNPSNDFICLKGAENVSISNVSIIDMFGKKVFTSSQLNNNKIDVSNLNSGIYTLSIASENTQRTVKFVKN